MQDYINLKDEDMTPESKVFYFNSNFGRKEVGPELFRVFAGTNDQPNDIDFTSQEISLIRPGSFSNLGLVKRVFLGNNRIRKIDASTFAGLTGLEELILEDNEIESICWDNFYDFEHLKILFITVNCLEAIDTDMFANLKSLEVLRISMNEISKIGGYAFAELKKLKLLDLLGNKLTKITATHFKGLDNLEVLCLSCNEITDIDENAFRELKKLRELYIDNNKLVGVNTKWFESIESEHVGLIDLGRNPFKRKFTSFYNRSRFDPDSCLEWSGRQHEDIMSEFEEAGGYFTQWEDFCQQFKEIYQVEMPLESKSLADKYQIVEKLNGNIGSVYSIIERKNNQNLMRAMRILEGKAVSQAELKIISSIDHENVIKYFDHFEIGISNEVYFSFITELCEKSDLAQMIDKAIKSEKRFTEYEMLTICFHVTSGLKYLHSKNIIHRNIKPENILVTKNNVVKLSNPNISKLTNQTNNSWQFQRTLLYMSPELIQSFLNENIPITNKTDIWSFGCVLYELMNLRPPFPLCSKEKVSIPDLGNSICFTPILKRTLIEYPDERIDSAMLYDQLMVFKNFSQNMDAKYVVF